MGDPCAIHGSCDGRFAAVREAMARNFREHDEIGAAVAIALDGRMVVDLWGGSADEARTRAWERDTLVNVFSVGKAMAAIVLLRLVERGALAVDEPVARRWPEFAAAGKEAVTVRMLLAHTAGVPGVRRPLPDFLMYDWTAMCEVLAAEAPWWKPGTAVGYHVNTFGFLVGEVVRRTAGERIGARFAREVAGSLGADFSFGAATADERRLADYVFTNETFAADPLEMRSDDDARRDMLRAVYMNPPGISGMGTVNTPAWRTAEMPSTNGHATARGVARIYAALACGGTLDGVTVLASETLAQATREVSSGTDVVLRRPSRFGLGFQLNGPERRLGPGPRTFGHFGAGGAVGFADPDARLAFAYTMNRSGPRWQNPRNRALIEATYASL